MHFKEHSVELVKAFRPIQRFLQAIGQVPFQISKNKEDETYSFHFRKISFSSIVYYLAFIIYGMIMLHVTVGGAMALLGENHHSYKIPVLDNFKLARNFTPEYKEWESVMFVKNWVILLIFYCWMLQSMLGSFLVIYGGKDHVHYFNYWNRVVQVMDMDMTVGIRQYMRRELVTFVLVSTIFVTIFATVANVRVSCGLISCFCARFYISNLPTQEWFVVAQIVGFLIVLYGYAGSRAAVYQFVFFSQLLKNGCRIWNNRLRDALDKGNVNKDALGDKMDKSTTGRRLRFRVLLKDHLIIAQLFKMTEKVFATILKLYYLVQLFCLIFELLFLYFLLGPEKYTLMTFTNFSYVVQSPFGGPVTANLSSSAPTAFELNKNFERKQLLTQTALVLTLLLQTSISCYNTTIYANAAYEEAMEGFQVIRKRGLMFCVTKNERNFMHTLMVSFTKDDPIVISANGYFLVNKALIIGIMGSVCAYIIIMIQFDFENYEVLQQDYRMNWGPPKIHKGYL